MPCRLIHPGTMADLNFTKAQIPKLLQWLNDWNAQMYPVRVFVTNNRF